MSRPFAKYPAKPAFGVFKEPQIASDYIINKKTKYTFCNPNICYPNKNIGSQNNYLSLKHANRLENYQCVNSINKTQLYINLITKLDLSNVPVIEDLSGNTYPVIIDPNITPFLKYNIDPTGDLFGNTPCGINNFENYLVYNPPYTTSSPRDINNL